MHNFFVRDLDQGMGTAVAARTYLRKGEDWGELSERVSLGNTLLHSSGKKDFELVRNSIASGKFLSAGRHLQHGDETQPERNLEVFSNCSTSISSFIQLLLLLNGSGVGRNYSDEFMITDWRNLPKVTLSISHLHTDALKCGTGIATLDARQLDYDVWHNVEDSREGWARALELLETQAYMGSRDLHIVLDFSLIRKEGAPIGGMQNRPASGPHVLMDAFSKMILMRESSFDIWKQTMMVDHFAAECVANGGARRAARIAVKYWKDKGIFDFINIKRDNPWMWSSNNSVGVDEEFWIKAKSDSNSSAGEVYEAMCYASYYHGTGEPGFLNLDKLTVKE